MDPKSNDQQPEPSSANHNANGSTSDAYSQPSKRWNAGGKGSRGGGADDGKGGSGILRVSQACTNCRRMKMRCVNADNPPCKRCAHFGEECVVQSTKGRLTAKTKYESKARTILREDRGGSSTGFEEDSQADGRIGAWDRIGKLEDQVGSMQSTLKDILAAIQGGATGPTERNADPDLPWFSGRDAATSRAHELGDLAPNQPGLPNSAYEPPIATSEITRSIGNFISQQPLDHSNLSHIRERSYEGDIGLRG